MNRVIASTIAGLSMSVVAAGTAFAGCPGPTPGNPPPPAPTKPAWQYINEPGEIPAGYACKDRILTRQSGHVREPYEITRNGKKYIVFEADRDFKVSLYNPKTKKRIVKDSSGDFYDHLVKGGRDSESIGKGANFLFGKGIKGLLFLDGYQKFYVKNYETPKQKITLQVVKGKYIELCAKLGSKPVNGKNPPPPPAP